MDNQKFGKFIKELRKKSNMTQKELGEKLNVTDKAVSKWERGLSFPDITIINSLAETFGITSSEILNAELGKKEEIDIEKAIQEPVESVEETVIKNIEKEKVNEALKDLTSTQFRRIDLHIVNEITIRDVAKLEKVQKSQIQKSLELGLKKIKKFFEE